MDTLLTNSLKEHPLQREFYEPLRGDEWREFYGDIDQRGITQPIIVSSRDGFTVVDGHQRFYAAKELGLEAVPAIVRAFADELEEARWMVGNNDRRRHESAEKIANRAEYFLRKFSQKSNRVVAQMAQVSKDTVRRQREKLEGAGEIPKHERTEGVDGKSFQRSKPVGARAPTEPQPNPDLTDYLHPRAASGYNPARHADSPKPEPEIEPGRVELPVFRPSEDYRRLGAALDTLARLSASDLRQLMREEPRDYPLPVSVRLASVYDLVRETLEQPEGEPDEPRNVTLN